MFDVQPVQSKSLCLRNVNKMMSLC